MKTILNCILSAIGIPIWCEVCSHFWPMRKLCFKSVIFVLALAAVDLSLAATPVPSAWAGQLSQIGKSVSFFRRPLIENGPYAFSEKDIAAYYRSLPYTRDIIELQSPLKEPLLFKINDLSEFQAKDWYRYYQRLKGHQQRWVIHFKKLLQREGFTTFNEAKQAFFSALDFSFKTFSHLAPYHFMKEWGGLNHPPLQRIDPGDLGEFSKYYQKKDYTDSSLDGSRYFDARFHKDIDEVSQTELTFGNQFQVLADHRSFEAKLHFIRKAQKSVWVSSLVFVKDAPTEKLAEALIQKKNEGLDVRVIDENILRFVHPEIIRKLKKSGIQVVDADDFFKYNSQVIYHIKTVIVDGAIAILGGQNMIDADMGSQGTDFKNRDLDVLAIGPVVTDVALNFMEDWNHFVLKKKFLGRNRKRKPFSEKDFDSIEARKQEERKASSRGADNYSRWLGDRRTRMKGIARYIAQKPYRNPSVITDSYLKYLDQVQSYLGITNPQALDTRAQGRPNHRGLRPIYNSFKNFNRLYDRIQNLMGEHPNIHVDYLTSGVNFGLNEAVPMTMDRINRELDNNAYVRVNLNQLFIDRTNHHMAPGPYKNLVNDFRQHPNADVWINISFMHTKVFYFDRIAASLGSFNVHHNATDHAYECTMVIQDEGFNRQLDQEMVLDMANSVPFVYKKIVDNPANDSSVNSLK